LVGLGVDGSAAHGADPLSRVHSGLRADLPLLQRHSRRRTDPAGCSQAPPQEGGQVDGAEACSEEGGQEIGQAIGKEERQEVRQARREARSEEGSQEGRQAERQEVGAAFSQKGHSEERQTVPAPSLMEGR
jgi:uncharacterized membrane protein